MMRYKLQTGTFDLANAGTGTLTFNPENTPMENLAIWVSSQVSGTFTVNALVNGNAVALAGPTAFTGSAGKPQKIWNEAGPYPYAAWPIQLVMVNGVTAGHYDFALTALIRNAYQ